MIAAAEQRAARERPILFSGKMVRALLEARKTQTRRVIQGLGERTHSPFLGEDGVWRWMTGRVSHVDDERRCPYGNPGDKLWVRETWRGFDADGSTFVCRYAADDSMRRVDVDANRGWTPILMRAARQVPEKWQPSIYMPRELSRITLRMTNVRAERVQEITQPDAIAEGVRASDAAAVFKGGKLIEGLSNTPRGAFACLWDSINGERDGCSWDANPWVWVVSFEKVQ